jgi:predicted RNase H-like nuclease
MALRQMRAGGVDPAHGEDAAAKRGKTFRKWAEARKAWEKDNPHIDLDRERRRFQIEILPALSSISVFRIAKATGLSLRYSSLIKRANGCHIRSIIRLWMRWPGHHRKGAARSRGRTFLPWVTP